MELLNKFFSPSLKKEADKSLSATETVARVETKLRQANIKILKKLKRTDKGRLGIPVYTSIYDTQGTKVTGKFKQMGKGCTKDLAKASALMELIERYSLFKTLEGPFINLPLKDLDYPSLTAEEILSSVIDPEEDKAALDTAQKIIPLIPFHWTKALEVHSKQEKFLPIYWFWLLYEYNGSAAGNTWPEAAVQGTCEIIERHVSARVSNEKIPLPLIEIDIDHPEINQLIQCYKRLGINLSLQNMTLDMPIPTIGALAYDPSTYPHRSEIVYTAGTAPSPTRAVIRALTEVAQLAGDFDTEGHYLESGLPKIKDIDQISQVIDTTSKINLSSLPDLSSQDHVEELKMIAYKLLPQGFKLYLCDFTLPELDIPVIYALIPKAHFRKRLFISPLYQIVRVVSLHLSGPKALSILKEIENMGPKRYYIFSYIGQILKSLNALEESARYLEKALKYSPPLEDKVAIYCHLAHTFLVEKKYDQAQEIAEKGLSLRPLGELYNLLGTALYKQKNYLPALEAYLKAIDLNPQSAQDYANAGACWAQMGLKEEAKKFFSYANQIDPFLDLTAYKKLLTSEKEG